MRSDCNFPDPLDIVENAKMLGAFLCVLAVAWILTSLGGSHPRCTDSPEDCHMQRVVDSL